jgi:SAM-dependent methyltransferase
MKKFILRVADCLSFFWRFFPSPLRIGLLTGLLVLDSRHRDSRRGLVQLFKLRDKVDWLINERAMAYGEGWHPKHRLTGYHEFFIERINVADFVLDVGCGYGAVARSIALAHPGSTVVGIDHDHSRLAKAKSSDIPENLTFVYGDATQEVPSGKWNVVVLSNILEHVDDRIILLKKLRAVTMAKRFLIRVPMFERDWQMALRRELEVDFRSDPDHRIEHTVDEFRTEILESGLYFYEMVTVWGEIWADCRLVEKSN